jgi:hypothetical protein
MLESLWDHTKCSEKSVSTRTTLHELIKESFLRRSSTTPSTPSGRLSDAFAGSEEVHSGGIATKPLPLRAMLTSKVLSVTASYAAIALFHVAFSSISPVFYATPIERGGLSLDPPRIGAILGASSLAHATFHILFYAKINYHFGAGVIYTTGALSGIPIVILFPVINALARAHGMSLAVWLAIGVQHALVVSVIMCYRMSI